MAWRHDPTGKSFNHSNATTPERDLRQEYRDDDQRDLLPNSHLLMSSQMQDLQRLRILSSQVELDTAVAA